MPAMFESDNWLDWEPDAERASREAYAGLQPYASMSKRQIFDLMLRAKGGREWEFLQEYFLNRCSQAEISMPPLEFIRSQYRGFRGEERLFLVESVTLALRRRITGGVPRPVPKFLSEGPNLVYRPCHPTSWPLTLAPNSGDVNPRR
jgi:hypothetical protein